MGWAARYKQENSGINGAYKGRAIVAEGMTLPPLAHYEIRWRLIYGAIEFTDEPPEGLSIKHAKRGAKELHLIDSRGIPVMRVVIPTGDHPIFYRRRSMDANPHAGSFPDSSGPRLDAIVFGHGALIGVSCKGALWEWKNNRAVDCSKANVDEVALANLLSF